MTQQNYALVKDNKIVNLLVFDSPTQELLLYFKNEYKVDALLPATEKAVIDGIWDGTDFITPQPYPSWTLDFEKNWQPPVPKPDTPMVLYTWDEGTLQWKETLAP